MGEFVVPNIGHPYSRAQTNCDDPVNNSETESSSLLIYEGLGNLYQQENKDALKRKKTGADFTLHLY